MIAYLDGVVLERLSDTEVVLLVAGVGYHVSVDARGTRVGDPLSLWIHSITSEFGTRLFGFEDQVERAKFLELLGVKGVGPKTAMTILFSGVNPRSLMALQAVKGVGRKTAEAIVAELGAAA